MELRDVAQAYMRGAKPEVHKHSGTISGKFRSEVGSGNERVIVKNFMNSGH